MTSGFRGLGNLYLKSATYLRSCRKISAVTEHPSAPLRIACRVLAAFSILKGLPHERSWKSQDIEAPAVLRRPKPKLQASWVLRLLGLFRAKPTQTPSKRPSEEKIGATKSRDPLSTLTRP